MSTLGLGRSVKPVCIYHSDTEQFKSALSSIRKLIHIPKELYNRVAMVVCSCRKAGHDGMSVLDLELFIQEHEQLKKYLITAEEQNQAVKINDRDRAIAFVRKAIYEARLGNESSLRFVCVLEMAIEGDFQLLQAEKKAQEQRYSKPEKKKGKRWSTASMVYLMKKRKRQTGNDVKILRLPIFGGNMRLLQQQAEIGSYFNVIGVKYKPCVIEVDYTRTGEMMKQNKQETVLKVWCSNTSYKAMSQTLVSAAKQVQATFTKRPKSKYSPARIKRIFAYPDSNHSCNEVLDPQIVKENKWDDFSKKYHADMHHRSNSHSKDALSLRCYNCQKIADDSTKGTACRYHPGFVAKKKWSCCQEVGNVLTEDEDHQLTGCQQGCHLWRYRTDKKLKNKQLKTREITAITAFTKLRFD